MYSKGRAGCSVAGTTLPELARGPHTENHISLAPSCSRGATGQSCSDALDIVIIAGLNIAL